MSVKAVGILSPGEMGSGVGGVLRSNGMRVLTCLKGRSERTRGLAAKAGFEDVPSLEDLVREADIVMCILVPSEAVDVARSVADAVRSTKADVLYAECNAIAPQTTSQIGEIITAAGARFADGGIIGGPPKGQPSDGRIYTSGPGANELAQLNQWGLNIPVVGPEIGQASGLKLCYAALTKGLQMLGTELLVAARALGLEEALKSEQQTGNIAKVREYLERATPTMPPKAHRWVGEMEEVAAMFEALGMTPRMLLGAADMCEFVAASPIGKETPEDRQDRGLYEIVAALAETLPQPAATR